MDEFTKRKVRRAIEDNPGLPVKFIIMSIRQRQMNEAVKLGIKRRG